MLSVVFRYLDEERQEKVAIGSMKFFNKRMQTAKQLIEFVGWRSTDEQWRRLTELGQQELYEVLEGILHDILHVEKPN